MDIVFYLNWVALGIILVSQAQLVNMSVKAWKHVEDEKFGKCIKTFLTCIGTGTLSGIWLILSHYYFM